MSTDLEERLRSHGESFNGLLSLIPAKLYYGEDVSDQWKRRKQTPEQKRAAKMAKLDPANWKSAKDVMDERSAAAKRKRSDDQASDNSEVDLSVALEQPKYIQDQEHQNLKRRKVDDVLPSGGPGSALTIEEKEQRAAAKKAARTEKAQKETEKVQRQKARKLKERTDKEQQAKIEKDGSALAEPIVVEQQTVINSKDADAWSTASSSEDVSDVLSPPAASGISSSSSIPSLTDQPTQPSSHPTKLSKSQPPAKQQAPPQLSIADHEAARARLASAISSFRTARKANESDTSKPRNRAELLEQRRRKEEARREARKEQRRKEKEEAARMEDEEIARRFSPGGSGSLLASPRSPSTKDSEDPAASNNFSYGRIEFNDGTKVDTNVPGGIQDTRKRKGPQDAQTALKAAQNKAARLAGLDEDARKDIASKDMWLTAKRRAHGERVKDDTSLLKKALKRQESQKKKSEKEWTERKEGVRAAQESRQRKRTENLARRKEEKLERRTGTKSGKKVKKRPGFEGSFRGRTSSGAGKKK